MKPGIFAVPQPSQGSSILAVSMRHDPARKRERAPRGRFASRLGDVDPPACEVALKEILPPLQRQYDLT
jgi:hypothetical protein